MLSPEVLNRNCSYDNKYNEYTNNDNDNNNNDIIT